MTENNNRRIDAPHAGKPRLNWEDNKGASREIALIGTVAAVALLALFLLFSSCTVASSPSAVQKESAPYDPLQRNVQSAFGADETATPNSAAAQSSPAAGRQQRMEDMGQENQGRIPPVLPDPPPEPAQIR